MFKIAIILMSLLAAVSISAQEIIIKDFPLGVGGKVDRSLLLPFLAELRAMADTLKAYPLATATITGGADGNEYRTSHDAKNPGLALGRAHLLRNLMINELGVDSSQLVVTSKDVPIKGGEYRFVGIRLDRTISDLDARMNALEKRPPVERHFTEIKEPMVSTNPFENLGILFGIGGSTSPYGGVPIVSTALTFGHLIYVEAFFGHTFWDGSYRWQDQDLDTKRRLIGGQVIVFPYEDIPLGIVGGWVRAEQISQQHYEYVRMSEGPIVGLRLMPVNFFSVTGAYNPVKQRVSGQDLSDSDNGNFRVSASLHLPIGGAK